MPVRLTRLNLLCNDVRAEAVFPRLVEFVLGATGVPWDGEYGFR